MEVSMIKGFAVVLVSAAFLAAAGLASGPAFAKSDKAAKSQLQECKKISDPKAKDECVSNAKNATQKGKGDAGGKSTKKGKGKAKDM
jgi:hypothetical protein